MWIFIPIVASQSCQKYGCHTGGYSISPTCAYVSPTNDVVLQICDSISEPYCDASSTGIRNYTCKSSSLVIPRVSYPGEPCSQDSDCITDKCALGFCAGSQPGATCVSNSDCGVGLYCNSGFFCAAQLPAGSACTSDYECLNSYGCNNTLFEDGTCVEYFSIPYGYVTGMCIDLLTEGLSNLCQTGSCYSLSPGSNSLGVCEPSYSNLYEYPKECEEDIECVGYNTVNSTIGICSCGMNLNGNSYCDAFLGDPPGNASQSILQLHTKTPGISNCHTQRRFDEYCILKNLGPDSAYEYSKSKQLATDTARYQNNDYCTQSILNYNYFNITPANFKCPSYSCDNTLAWAEGICITFIESYNTYAINPCDANSNAPYCNTSVSASNKWNNSTCTNYTGPAKYPGSSCVAGFECLLGLCSNGLCQGLLQGQACSSSKYCNPGLYCNSANYVFTCQPLIPEYGQGCGSDYDCANDCGCLFSSSGPPGTCVPYFSIKVGEEVQCSGSVSLLCSSGACYTKAGLIGTCTYPPVSSNTLPSVCNTNNDCIGTNTLGQSFQGACTCGYNPNGTSYCSVFAGDSPGQEFLKSIQQFFSYKILISYCQTTRRLSFECFDLVASKLGTVNTWYTKLLYFYNYPLYINNDQCVKTVYTYQYWNNTQYFNQDLKSKADFNHNLAS